MLTEGLVLMSIGMGTVFTFLVILLVAVVIMGSVVKKLNEMFPPEVKQVKVINNTDDVEIAIAIAAAKLR